MVVYTLFPLVFCTAFKHGFWHEFGLCLLPRFVCTIFFEPRDHFQGSPRISMPESQTFAVGALRKGPPFHGSRSSREIKIENASCQMGGREVTR